MERGTCVRRRTRNTCPARLPVEAVGCRTVSGFPPSSGGSARYGNRHHLAIEGRHRGFFVGIGRGYRGVFVETRIPLRRHIPEKRHRQPSCENDGGPTDKSVNVHRIIRISLVSCPRFVRPIAAKCNPKTGHREIRRSPGRNGGARNREPHPRVNGRIRPGSGRCPPPSRGRARSR